MANQNTWLVKTNHRYHIGCLPFVLSPYSGQVKVMIQLKRLSSLETCFSVAFLTVPHVLSLQRVEKMLKKFLAHYFETVWIILKALSRAALTSVSQVSSCTTHASGIWRRLLQMQCTDTTLHHSRAPLFILQCFMYCFQCEFLFEQLKFPQLLTTSRRICSL